jgi:hypothetical protein
MGLLDSDGIRGLDDLPACEGLDMTNDETLRQAHKDGTWDEFAKEAASIPMITAPDTAAFVDRLILERAKRRDALGVDAEPVQCSLDGWPEHVKAGALSCADPSNIVGRHKPSSIAKQVAAAQRQLATWPQWMRDAIPIGPPDGFATQSKQAAEYDRADDIAELRARNAELEAQIEAICKLLDVDDYAEILEKVDNLQAVCHSSHALLVQKNDEINELRARIEACKPYLAHFDETIAEALKREYEMANDLFKELTALRNQIEACKPYLAPGETPAYRLAHDRKLYEDWSTKFAVRESELTALRNRKPNYEAAERVMRTTFESGWRPWYGDVARKIADAAFEPREDKHG